MPSAQELIGVWIKRAGAARDLLETRQDVARALRELCVPEVEPYPVSYVAADDATTTMILVPEEGAMIEVSVSGTANEPVITMVSLPLVDTPLAARMTECWGPGDAGARCRVRTWSFAHAGAPGWEQAISYAMPEHGIREGSSDDDQRATAYRLAAAAGWPLPNAERSR